MSQVKIQYDEFLSLISQTVANVDVNLLMKIMYLEKKLPDVPPKVELDIKYKLGVDLMKKQEKLQDITEELWYDESIKNGKSQNLRSYLTT